LHIPRSLTAAAALVSTLVLSSLANAQKEDSRDEAAIHDYVLTMPKVQTYAAAVKDYEATGDKNPAIASECKGQLDDEKMSLTDKQKVIESSCPQMNAWIKQHGLTAHDFLFIPMGLMTAGFAQVAAEQGGKPPAFVNPANIQFIKEHKAELEKMHVGSSEE
jgi:hypothetical protein